MVVNNGQAETVMYPMILKFWTWKKLPQLYPSLGDFLSNSVHMISINIYYVPSNVCRFFMVCSWFFQTFSIILQPPQCTPTGATCSSSTSDFARCSAAFTSFNMNPYPTLGCAVTISLDRDCSWQHGLQSGMGPFFLTKSVLS